jgi:Zn-dependent M32 family carboxypeptidase
MGVHESQSLFWERNIFQSREFWDFLTPLIHKHFPHTIGVSSEEFYLYCNQVTPGFIRVDADEVTYPLHIILRFELEQGLFDDSISVDDLPTIWNKKIKDMLGLAVESNKLGVLQDVHWSFGAMGYFPSYTLGAMIACQLHEQCQQSIPDMKDKIRKGEFKEIREWLRNNVHEKGSLYSKPDDLLLDITGKPLDPQVFVKYLEKKYKDIYNL